MSTMAKKLLALVLGALADERRGSRRPRRWIQPLDQIRVKRDYRDVGQLYNVGDADTAAGLYAEDAVLMPPHDRFRSRAAEPRSGGSSQRILPMRSPPVLYRPLTAPRRQV